MAAHLLAFTDPRCPASTRYRVAQFEGLLASRGVHLETTDWPDDIGQADAAARDALLDRVERAGTVVFQRCLPDPSMLRRIRGRARRLVYDFDDAIIYTESTHGAPHRRLRSWWRFRRMMRCCDSVTAGNSYLAEMARSHAAAGELHVLPTAVELARYDGEPAPVAVGSAVGAASASDGPNRSPAASSSRIAPANGAAGGPVRGPVIGPVIGWIGSRSTLPYLEMLRGPLERLSQQIPGLTVRAICDQRPDLGKTLTEWVPWRVDTEVHELKRLQVGLAPLPDDRWTRGKCGLRLLQYLAAGIPAVASPVGTQAEVTAAGAALPANSQADWPGALHSLLSDEKLAAGLARRGHQLARERFDAAVLAGTLQTAWCGSV